MTIDALQPFMDFFVALTLLLVPATELLRVENEQAKLKSWPLIDVVQRSKERAM
jgi:hypothetical protein